MRPATVPLLGAICLGAVLLIGDRSLAGAQGDANLVFSNDCLRYVVGPDGANCSFVDVATGKDYCRQSPATPVARVSLEGKWHNAASASLEGDRLLLTFVETSATVTLRMTTHKRHFVLEVLQASPGIDELQFPNVQLIPQTAGQADFTSCALALNLQTNVTTMPGPSDRVMASCVARFGIVGASVAMIGCPTRDLREVLKEVVLASDSLPRSPMGGPWAMDSSLGRASYLFASPSEENVDEVIRTVKSVGFNQIEIHGGRGTYRFGDCLPNPKLYPRGVASLKAVIDRCHQAGIYVGMHPYAFFIDKATPWVTPVPDPGLASDATFTLSSGIAADADSVPVNESTQAMSTITGFFVRNSVTLRIGEELITYRGLSKEPPYAFTTCTRGALGTKAVAHSAGEKVYHLKECFGLFAPDPESDLFTKVIEANARFFNECGFDTMYQDALDGEDVLGGAQNSWHYGSKYIWELWKRLDHPAAVEYSTFHHHLWVLRSRHGAWDHPTRSYPQFVDLHIRSNQANERMFLPSNLGWWAFRTWLPPQGEPTFAEDIEYWCAKGLGTDSGLSLVGYNPAVPAQQRLADIVRQYEELRHAGTFSEAVKARLREPGAHFALTPAADGSWEFVPLTIDRHLFRGPEGEGESWAINNPNTAQVPALRLEAMMSAAPYESDKGVTLATFTSAQEFAARTAAPSVKADLEPIGEAEVAYARLTATNSGTERRGSWASFKKTFDPPLNLSAQQGLGVWIHGDGKGEVLNFQVKSPSHLTSGLGEHYVVVDFEGWRYFELIETDSDRFSDYAWPYGGLYAMYRETVNYSSVESLTIWCNNLPAHDSIQVDLRPVRALPLVSAQVVDPQVTVNGATVGFKTGIASGSYLEVNAAGKGTLYGPTGETLGEVSAEGKMPELRKGPNTVRFASQKTAIAYPRTRITVFSQGEALK
jgi:hypothetical protein